MLFTITPLLIALAIRTAALPITPRAVFEERNIDPKDIAIGVGGAALGAAALVGAAALAPVAAPIVATDLAVTAIVGAGTDLLTTAGADAAITGATELTTTVGEGAGDALLEGAGDTVGEGAGDTVAEGAGDTTEGSTVAPEGEAGSTETTDPAVKKNLFQTAADNTVGAVKGVGETIGNKVNDIKNGIIGKGQSIANGVTDAIHDPGEASKKAFAHFAPGAAVATVAGLAKGSHKVPATAKAKAQAPAPGGDSSVVVPNTKNAPSDADLVSRSSFA